MNIEDYEFVDYGLGTVLSANNIAVSINAHHVPWFGLYKADVIALAKHFQLTADDIKDN